MANGAALVYLVTNRVNQKTYVGVTRHSIAKRWGEHKAAAKAGRSSALYSAIRKYGAQAFDVVGIASCLSLESANEVERAVIQSIAPDYNMTNGGEFTVGKRVLSDEAKERIRLAHVGKTISPEQRATARENMIRFYQEHPEAKARSTEVLRRGRETMDRAVQRAAASRSSSGRVWSAESRAKLSRSCMGRKYGAEVIRRMAATKRKLVECTTLGAVFDSVSDAAEMTGLSISGVSRVCRGDRVSANGLKFVFV